MFLKKTKIMDLNMVRRRCSIVFSINYTQPAFFVQSDIISIRTVKFVQS